MLSLSLCPRLSPVAPGQAATLWTHSVRFLWRTSPAPKRWAAGELAEFAQRARALAHLATVEHHFETLADAEEFAKLYAAELLPAGNTRCLYRARSKAGLFVEHALEKGKAAPMRAVADYVEFQ